MREPDRLMLGGILAYSTALCWFEKTNHKAKFDWEDNFMRVYHKEMGPHKVDKAFYYACDMTGVHIPLYRDEDYV